MAARTVRWTTIETPLGEGMAASTVHGICRVALPGTRTTEFVDRLSRSYPGADVIRDSTAAEAATEQLEAYWQGEHVDFSVPVDLSGTLFQQSVWKYLEQIPYGQTVTYAQVAEAVGAPRAYQAAGRAVGANPVPLIVPCHRVIGSDGSLTGFAGGISTKRWLLEHEGRLLV